MHFRPTLALILVLLAGLRPLTAAPAASATSIAELQQNLEAILARADARTPGAAIAIVRRDGPEWIAGLGRADLATRRPVTPDTLFRIGSTTKAFAALSLLKLQEEGRLSLQDTLASRAPEVAFSNPWEATDPVRLVHLLEHTTGWDDVALREYAHDAPTELPLREGLAYHPKSRTSRWKPGTRFAYSNSGSGTAAYVVEKITGERFEDYVARTWFAPLQMPTANFFGTPEVRERLTRLYRADGVTPYPYWKILLRAAGALNVSAREMANYVSFYVQRGAFAGQRLLSVASLDRMEAASTTYAAREGLKTGYGLANFTTIAQGWVYHGHTGGVMGGLTELAYFPELEAGYCVMINSAQRPVLADLTKQVRDYLTREKTPPPRPPPAPIAPGLAAAYDGWYEPISPRQEIARAFERLLLLTRVTVQDTRLAWHPINRRQAAYVAVSERLFRRESDPVPTLALIADRSEGTLIQNHWQTYRRVPTAWAITQIVFVAVAALLCAATLVFAIVWVPRALWGGLRGAPHLGVRLLPVFTLVTLGAMADVLFAAPFDIIERFGRPTGWAIAFFLLSLMLPVGAVAGLVQAWRARALRPRAVWWLAFATSGALTIVSAYLALAGIIGLRTWT